MSLDTLIEAANYLEKIEASRDKNLSGYLDGEHEGHMKLDPNLPISFHFHTYSSQVPTQNGLHGNATTQRHNSLSYPIISKTNVNNVNSTNRNRGYSISLPSQSELSLSSNTNTITHTGNLNHIMVLSKNTNTNTNRNTSINSLTRSGSFSGRSSGDQLTRGGTGSRSRTQSSSVYDKDSMISNRHRELHKTLEKNRRAHLRHCFEQLKQELPKSEYSDKKSSHINIIHCAIKYIENLKRNDLEYENELERLSRTKVHYLNQVTQLREDLILNNKLNTKCKGVDIEAVLHQAEEKILRNNSDIKNINSHYNNEVLVDGVHMNIDDEHQISQADVIVDLDIGNDYDDEATNTASECADDVHETLNPNSFNSVTNNGPLLSHA